MSQVSSNDGFHNAAPLGTRRTLPAVPVLPSRRFRRRGPRSQLALARRSVPRHRRSLPGMCPGESGHVMPVSFSMASQPSSVSSAVVTVNELSDARVNVISNARQSVASTSLRAGLNGICIYLVNIQCLL